MVLLFGYSPFPQGARVSKMKHHEKRGKNEGDVSDIVASKPVQKKRMIPAAIKQVDSFFDRAAITMIVPVLTQTAATTFLVLGLNIVDPLDPTASSFSGSDLVTSPSIALAQSTTDDSQTIDDSAQISQTRPPSTLAACASNSNCVSSNYLEPPNRYLAPMQTLKDRDTAFSAALRDLTQLSKAANQKENQSLSKLTSISIDEAKDYYIHATVPGTAPGSLDDVELLFLPHDGIIQWKCQARVTLPPPPFCIQRNCINGSMDQRQRLQALSSALGMPLADQAQQNDNAKWTPIFWNADKVPGFDDDAEL